MPLEKKLYHGTFNWKGERKEDWCRAYGVQQAFRLLTARIGVCVGTTGDSVRKYFLSKAHSYEIKEVTET